MGKGVWNVREEYCFQRKLKVANSEKESESNPVSIPPQTPPAGGQLGKILQNDKIKSIIF